MKIKLFIGTLTSNLHKKLSDKKGQVEFISVLAFHREDEGSARKGRQFSFSTGQFAGQYPASTMPLAPVQSANLLCRTPSG